jgi:TolB-like protein/Tfp pilus assembly protein PilF
MAQSFEENKAENKAKSNAATPKTLAIVPFRLLHGESETPLEVGLADALTIRLHDVPDLSVRPTGAVLQLAKKITDPFELGKKLGVDYVLDGHILPAGERTRFSVQLLDVANHSMLWAAQFDENEADIFHLEDSISTRIVELLLPRLAEKANEQKFEKSFTEKSFVSPDTSEIIGEDRSETGQLHNSQQETLTLPLEEVNETKLKFNRLSIAAIAFAVLAVGAIGYFLFFQPGDNAQNQPKTVVILPFKSENAATNSVGIGLADVLSGKLGAVHAVSVLSSNAGREIAKTENEIAASARRLGADYVLRGSLQTIGEKSELDAEFINTKAGQKLFTEKFISSGGDLLTLQNLVAARVLRALSIVPTAQETARLNKRHTENALAYELYLIARFQMTNRSPENLRRAAQIFAQAAERDPNFALPYVGIADCNSLLALYGIPPPVNAYKIAEENALRALALDSDLSEAYASLGYVRFNGERNFAAAEKEFRQAIALNPSYATAHHWFALALTGADRHDESISEIKIAQKLEPTAPAIKTAAGIVYFRARRYEEGLAQALESLKTNPAFVPAHKVTRWIYQAQGNYEAALAAFQKERSYSGASESDLGWLIIQAQVEALGNRREQARQMLEKALKDEFVRQNPTSFSNEIALAYTALDDRENALAWLEKAYQANDHSICFLSVEPRYDKLSQDSRFVSLAQKSVVSQ